MIQKLSRWILIVTIGIVLLSPLPYWVSGIGQQARSLSAEISYTADGTIVSSPKAEARHSLAFPMRLHRMVMYPVLLLAFYVSGAAVAMRQWLEKRLGLTAAADGLSWRDVAVMGLFVVGLQLGLYVLYLPFNFYRSFILGHQFGLSTLTAAGWFRDWGLGIGIGLLTMLITWGGFYGLMRWFPRRWPIVTGAAMAIFTVVMILLAPVVITPLFYTVTPLTDDDLQQRLVSLADRADMHVDNVYVIDASAKTTAANAYFTGYGAARRIVLYDTLLLNYTPDEIEVILAHEMGHWYYRHVLLGTMGLIAGGWLGLFALRWLLNRMWRVLGLRSPADVASLPLLMALIYCVGVLSLPFENGLSRYGENQADQFALEVSQKPDAFISVFEQLAEDNLAVVDVPAWEKIIFYTHPPIVERINRVMTFKTQAEQVSN